MNNIENTKEKRKGNKKEDMKKEEKKKEEKKKEKKEEKNPRDKTEMETKSEELNWEDKNKMKQKLNKQKPPPRPKNLPSFASINLIDLNTKEEKIDNLEKNPTDENDKIMVDSVAITIESV